MVADSKQPSKLMEKKTGRKVHDGKITINVYSLSLQCAFSGRRKTELKAPSSICIRVLGSPETCT
jgi:hypothetical protein